MQMPLRITIFLLKQKRRIKSVICMRSLFFTEEPRGISVSVFQYVRLYRYVSPGKVTDFEGCVLRDNIILLKIYLLLRL